MTEMNYAGYIDFSSIEWPDHTSSVLFFRGCNAGCFYCYNKHILAGDNCVSLDVIKDKINGSKPFVEAIVMSGGECTEQPDALYELLKYTKSIGLKTGLYTNGCNPDIIFVLLKENLIDMISLDIKATWENYPSLTAIKDTSSIKKSLSLCIMASRTNKLEYFNVNTTVFKSNLSDIFGIDLYLPSDINQTITKGIIKPESGECVSDEEFMYAIKEYTDPYILTRPVTVKMANQIHKYFPCSDVAM